MSTVIKAGEAARIVGRLSTVDLADHLAEARAVVDDARQRASQIIGDTEAQAERVLDESRESGYREGYQRGFAEGKQAGHQTAYDESIRLFTTEHSDVVASMNQAIAELDAAKEDLMIAAEKDLLDFAVMLAKKLTFAIGRLYPEAVVENFKRALRLVESNTNLTVRVHPDQIASIDTFAETVLKRGDASRVVELVPDKSIAPGGCKVDSDRAGVDATLETQVEQIVALLLGEGQSDV